MQTFTGMQYLMIDIANQYGLDKEPYATRLAWVAEHEAELEDLVDSADPKHQFQYLAAVMAYRDAQNGIPTGHLVGFDACASGLQIMAALTGCKTTAASTGLTGNQRKDIYGDTTKAMALILGSEVDIARKSVKEAQMPFYYGSRQKPKDVFGDGTPEFYAFHKANKQVAPGAVELMDLLLSSWQSYALSHDWVMPDGFTVHCPVMVQNQVKIEVDELDHASFEYLYDINAGTEKGLSIAANTIHSIDGMVVRELCRRCNYDREKLLLVKQVIEHHICNFPDKDHAYTPVIEELATKSGFVSLVGIDHINCLSIVYYGHDYLHALWMLLDCTITRKSFPVVTVHDEFKCHPNNCDTVRQTYVDILAEIAESNMLEFILSAVQKTPIKIEKYTQDLGELIRESHYALS